MTASILTGSATRRGTRDHNCDAARIYQMLDGPLAAAVIDGTGNDDELADLAGTLATVAIRIGTRRGGLAGLITAGELIADGGHESAAVLAILPADGGPAVISWIGDCRAYYWDGTRLRQSTTDHTMGQQLRQSGGAPWEVAATHDHWLLLGLSSATAATVRQVRIPAVDRDLHPGDLILLTSDGVHDQVPHDRLVDLIETLPDPQELADAIVAVAIEDKDGYRDDATVVVLAASGS